MKFSALFLSLCLTIALAAPAFADPGHGHAYGHANGMMGNNGRHLGQLRHLRTGTLPDSQVIYALQHQSIYVARLRAMRTIDYSNIRIVRVSPKVKQRLHISVFDDTMLAYESGLRGGDGSVQVAQIFGGSNSGLLQQLEAIVAGIVVSNAINNATGGNLGGGAGASLAQVLLSSGSPLSDLLGVYLGGNGILNALVG